MIFSTAIFVDAWVPERIRRATEEVLSRADYQLEPSHNGASRNWLLTILRFLAKPFIWLFDAMEGMPDVLRWLIVVGLAILCAALIVHILWSFMTAFRVPRSVRNDHSISREVSLQPEDLERAAEREVEHSNYIGAIRLLFRACILRMEKAEKKPFHAGFTNRELLRRYRKSNIHAPLSHLVATIDAKWYGNEPCDASEYDVCRREHQKVCGLIGSEIAC